MIKNLILLLFLGVMVQGQLIKKRFMFLFSIFRKNVFQGFNHIFANETNLINFRDDVRFFAIDLVSEFDVLNVGAAILLY